MSTSPLRLTRTPWITWAALFPVHGLLLVSAFTSPSTIAPAATVAAIGLHLAAGPFGPLPRRFAGHLVAATLLLAIAIVATGGAPLAALAIAALPLWTRSHLPDDEAIGWIVAAVVAGAALSTQAIVAGTEPASLYLGATVLCGVIGLSSTAGALDDRDQKATLHDTLDELSFYAEREDSLIGARDAALEQSAIKDQFLSMMSFELRTPLTTIVGYAEMLSEVLEDLEEGEGARDARSIRHSSENLLEVVDNVLDLARLEAGGAELRNHPVEPDRIVHYAVNQAREVHEGESIQAEVDATGMVLGDGQRLGQLTSTLLKRALKRSQGAGVQIRLLRQTAGMQLVVTDSRPGLPVIGLNAGALAGIELTYADALARAMGGSLEIVTASSGGSSVIVRIPLRKAFPTPIHAHGTRADA